jgi:hypothetical protein
MGEGATHMTETYTFRYLNADGSFNGIAVVQLNDRYSAELSAENLMPKKAASVEIWCGDDLVGTEQRVAGHVRSLIRPYSHAPTTRSPRG